ncbi:MAG: hypothetical protein P8Z68_11465 [Kineosporiaceae bacterium]
MAVVGMDLRRRNLLELVLTGPGRNACVIVGDARAEAAMVDMDSYGALDLLAAQRRRHPGRPLLLTALDPLPDSVVGPDTFLAKPVRVDALVDALVSVRARLRVPAEPSSGRGLVHDATYYDPGRYLQGVVHTARDQAVARNRAVYIEGPWPTITVFPSTGPALVEGGADRLQPYLARLGVASGARLTFAPEPLFSPHHPDSLALDTLVWGLALAASDGRLPQGTSLDRRCSLRSWPNFTRLTQTPGAMAIAALWSRESFGLLDTASALDLPREHVFTFYSAVLALGLLAPAHVAHGHPADGLLPAGPAGPVGAVRDGARPSGAGADGRQLRRSGRRSPETATPLRGLLRRVFDRLGTRAVPDGER